MLNKGKMDWKIVWGWIENKDIIFIQNYIESVQFKFLKQYKFEI